MSNRTMSVLVAGAFAAAVSSLTAPAVLAQGMKQMSHEQMEKMMKENQAKTMKSLKTGKFEKS
jgi:hypothetical protein